MAKDWDIKFNTKDNLAKRLLSRLALAFRDVHREYLRYFLDENQLPSEVAWFYNERPNIGLIAAAAWRIPGWIALEEYRAPKSKKRSKSKKDKARNGRADLYIGTSKNDGYKDFRIESKLAAPQTPPGVRKALNAKNPNSELGRAMTDARAIKGGDYRLATVFVCPALLVRKKNKFEDVYQKVVEAFEESCKDLTKQKREWAAFWVKSPKVDRTWPYEKKKYAYPAIAVVMVSV